MAPKISIIVPAYNEEKYVARCLDSILNQTFTDFEVLCVDDGSTDNTFNILTEYSKKDSRIIPLKNTGKGVSSARNYGIENSKGEYLGFVDSDDFIQPQMYEFLYKAICENNVEIAFCNYKKTSELNKENFDYSSEKIAFEKILDFSDNDVFLENELLVSVVWNKLVKKTLIDFKFTNYKIGEDTIFCSELWNKTDVSAFVDLPLYLYYINSESASTIASNSKKWLDLILTRFLSAHNYKNFSRTAYSYFLNHGMKILLSYKYFSDNDDKKEVKKIFKKYISEYLKCSDISIKNKIYVLICMYFSFIYNFIRKSSDKTLR